MGKCPYCSKELHLGDFFKAILGKKRLRYLSFKGEHSNATPFYKMWICPFCDTILGFSEG